MRRLIGAARDACEVVAVVLLIGAIAMIPFAILAAVVFSVRCAWEAGG